MRAVKSVWWWVCRLIDAFVIVVFIGIYALLLFAMHAHLTEIGASPRLYWLGMVCSGFVFGWVFFPRDIIFPTRMSEEDWAKFHRL